MKKYLIAIFISAALCNVAYSQINNVVQSKEIKMKQYTLLVRVPENYGTEQAKIAGPEWEKLLAKWKAENVYILSFPFPKDGYTITGIDKVVKKEPVLAGNLKVVSIIILQASSTDEALVLAQSCPVLLYGGQVEVRELPKPIEITSK